MTRHTTMTDIKEAALSLNKQLIKHDSEYLIRPGSRYNYYALDLEYNTHDNKQGGLANTYITGLKAAECLDMLLAMRDALSWCRK